MMRSMIDLRSARITDHARSAMARREITEAQVRHVLRMPQATFPAIGRAARLRKAF
jgi:hypothetical protein